MLFEPQNKPKGLNRLTKAFLNSCRAVSWLIKHEAAFRQELLLLVVTILIAFCWDIHVYERGLLVISVLLVILVEIINTAIEATIDRVGYEMHPLSGLAKDLGSAAVLLTMLIAGMIWCAILWVN